MSARAHCVVVAALALALSFTPLAAGAATTLTVRIDLSEQMMAVKEGGAKTLYWPVSTARRGYRTPTGSFRPVRLERMWYSRKYDWSPMPFAVFFHHGYAIHGTTQTRKLGRPASHGCVRLRTSNARTLYRLIQRHGRGSTRIRVVP